MPMRTRGGNVIIERPTVDVIDGMETPNGKQKMKRTSNKVFTTAARLNMALGGRK